MKRISGKLYKKVMGQVGGDKVSTSPCGVGTRGSR